MTRLFYDVQAEKLKQELVKLEEEKREALARVSSQCGDDEGC